MKKYLGILKKCPLFDGIEEKNLLTMLHCLDARIASFDKKYTIFAEGSSSRYLGILLSGSAQITRVDYYGNRSILSEVHPSQLFAEAFALADIQTLPVNVIATEACDVMLIDCGHILHTCSNNCAFHQRMIFNLMRNMASKTIQFHQKIEITSKRSTREKLMTYLSMQARKENSNRFEIPFDRQELADYLEVDRSGLSAEIGKLKKEGLIDCEKNRFSIL